MSWLTFVLLALVLIFAVQGFRKGVLRMAISMGILFNGSWCYVLAESVYQ